MPVFRRFVLVLMLRFIELVEVHTGHILFKRKETEKHFVNIYIIKDKKLMTLNLKSEPDGVGLSHDGRYLIATLGTSIAASHHEYPF